MGRSNTDKGTLYGIKVKACPFCENSQSFQVLGPECEGMIDQSCVRCMVCWTDGPRVKTKKGSVQAWNSRSRTAGEGER